MTQYGFFIDVSRCTGCQACVIACKQWHEIPVGPVKWLRVFQWEKGAFPGIDLRVLPVMCFHCENPVCAGACPNRAIRKEEKYGAVLVSPEKCTGKRKCWEACPYGVPQFAGDAPGLKMSKCNLCLERLEKGDKPICVLSCSLRAMEFGPLDEIKAKFGTIRQLEDMPRYSLTQPAVVFKPPKTKTQIVQYDHHKALMLWQKRHPDSSIALPDVFEDPADVLSPDKGLVARNRLVLKAKTTEEQDYFTMDDE
jgi:anaerobic dimethyl sulfoxide reductase subunit B (iron-sulfur subunit)